MTSQITLQPIDAVEVTIVVDNSIDILVPSTETARRPPITWDWLERDQLRAEHGFSAAITVHHGNRHDSILYDAGLGRDTAVHNMDVLGIDPKSFRVMVLSHGHADHHSGLEGLFRRLGGPGMPLVLHPDAWRERRLVFPTGAEVRLPPPSRQDLDREGWQVLEERNPSYLLDDTIAVTGQVERVTDFERGMPNQHAYLGGRWEPDPLIWDDQAVVIHVRDRGLVIVSGCSHAGSINVLRHAQRITGIEQVHALIGGIHLSGGLFEPIIPPTVDEMIAISPDVLVPGHCTGWKAIHLIAAKLPDAYIQSNVGTCLRFGSIPTQPAAAG